MAVRGERRGDERREVKAGGAREESLSPSSAVKANVHPVVSPQGASNLHVDPTLEASHPCFVIPADFHQGRVVVVGFQALRLLVVCPSCGSCFHIIGVHGNL
ncbi:unnamed protein product [Musa acuminata var. zebrina]